MNLSSALLVGSLLATAPAATNSIASPLGDMPEVGVPFACGRIHTVSQGHDTGSHQHNDTYAWDFRMPEGTPIVAAREGGAAHRLLRLHGLGVRRAPALQGGA